MVYSLEQRDEAIWMCPIPVRISRIQELVDQYPIVQERINNFFESESFKAMFTELMNFIHTQRVWLDLSKEEIDSSRDTFMNNIKMNLKLNIFVNALTRVCTISGKHWEDLEQELFELTEKDTIERILHDFLEGVKSNAENMIAEFINGSLSKYTS